MNYLVKKILALLQKKSLLLIAIGGRGGSGKSTLAQKLKQKLTNTEIVHLDDFNYPMKIEDYTRLVDQVIVPLKKLGKAKYQIYDYKKKMLGEWKMIQDSSVVIVEGVTTLHPLLSSCFDYSIWVECPAEIGFKRGVARELELTGKDTTENWLKFMPLEESYIKDHSPQLKADYIVDGTETLHKKF